MGISLSMDKFDLDYFKNKILPGIRFRKFLPKIYTLLIIAGFTLTGLQTTFLPNLVICSSLFGDNICDPVGNYVVTFASFPGYILSGLITVFWPEAQRYVYLVALFLSSLLIYFLIGAFIDKLRVEKNKSLIVIYLITFVTLFVLFLMFAVLI